MTSFRLWASPTNPWVLMSLCKFLTWFSSSMIIVSRLRLFQVRFSMSPNSTWLEMNDWNSVEGLIKCQGLRAPHRGSAVIWNGRWIFTCFGSKLNVRRERCQMRPFSCWLTLSPPILWISFTLYSTHSHFNRNYYRNIKVKWRCSYPKSCNRINLSILEVSESSSVLSSWQLQCVDNLQCPLQLLPPICLPVCSHCCVGFPSYSLRIVVLEVRCNLF